ncbi:MAG: tRNA lysidine(34) synthetase TilS [Bacteroidales bacterium]|jgi:tRNA(Ile)-lysidine synthase|nr:tRNA lysidine(34) synthetase TilS [Bacteroidales bacterium]
MKDKFLDYLKNNSLLNQKILLAVSGGADSMVMFHLFLQIVKAWTSRQIDESCLCIHSSTRSSVHPFIRIGVAHCNFQLRGEDADEDEEFVLRETFKHNIPTYSIRFETEEYAKKQGLSIQMAARELRYSWFEQICKINDYAFIATAHHSDDNIETFLLNILRKTGISGLHGIKDKSTNIIRPLLFANKEEILAYAKQHNIRYRNDVSNSNDYYQRNYIRHHIIPQFKKLNPNFTKTLLDSIQIISKQEIVYKEHIHQTLKLCMVKENEEYIVEIEKIKHLSPLDIYLFEMLHPFGFNDTQVTDLIHCLGTKEEKRFTSASNQLLKTRDTLKIIPLVKNKIVPFTLDKADKLLFSSAGIFMEVKDNCKDFPFENNPAIAYFDLDKINFPLQIRGWKHGDFFYPFKGNGKRKLSDFFSDQKLNSVEKQTTKLLCNANGDILWITGLRSDNRYKVTKSTQKILILEICRQANE